MDRSKEKDLYRDTPVRYLGYTNEVGEAFRQFIGHRMVMATYGIATLYACADTADKSSKTYEHTKDVPKTLFAAGDTLLWQLLASVAIPGFTINRICATTSYLLEKQNRLVGSSRQAFVTGIGLAAIPFIIKPIDHLVDKILDNTFRKLYH